MICDFEGFNCEVDIDECNSLLNPHRCANAARCVDAINSYTCHCLAGWTGGYCAMVILSFQ